MRLLQLLHGVHQLLIAHEVHAGAEPGDRIARPTDWRERVRIGSDRKQSGTARENLTGVAMDLPSTLPQAQRQLVEFAAPGLRGMLGYT